MKNKQTNKQNKTKQKQEQNKAKQSKTKEKGKKEKKWMYFFSDIAPLTE